MRDTDGKKTDETDSFLNETYIEDEHGREWTEEELEEWFQAADEEEEAPPPFWQSPHFRKIIVGLMVAALCVQLFALFPRMYSLAAIRFLATSATLSQKEHIQQYKESVVVIRTDSSKGSGFIISEDGLVVTNRHVVDKSMRPSVHLPNGESYPARIIAIAKEVDLALLDIEAEGLPILPLAKNNEGIAGRPIYVIGNPLFFTNIANEGEVWGMVGDNQQPPLIALDAPVYKGNSGSPVLTHEGEVIGVVFATSSVKQNGEKHKIGLAVPVDWVWRLLDDIPN